MTLHTRSAAPAVQQVPTMIREATIVRAEKSESGTYRAIFSTGAAVRRFDWDEGVLYEETLSMQPGHVRMERMNAGTVPILLDHRQTVANVVGIVERAWLEDGKGWIQFRVESGTPEADAIRSKLDQGILTNVSAGYRVHRYEVFREAGKTPEYRATDWEPMEVSLVAVPADPGAQIRGEDSATSPCEIVVRTPATETENEGDEDMQTRSAGNPAPEGVETRAAVTPAPQAPVNLDQVRAEAAQAERTRAAEIKVAVRSAKLGDDVAEKLIAEGKTVDQARAFVLEELARADAQTETRTTVQVGQSFDAPDVVRSALVDGLAASIAPGAVKVEGKAIEFRGLSPLEGFATLLQARGERVPVRKEELVKRALHTTSDFPLVLGDVFHRVMTADYAAAAPSYKEIAQQKSFADFRPHYIARSSEFPALQPLNEAGEIKSASLNDISQETISVDTKAIKIGVTRQLLVNDSTNEISNLIGKYGRRIASMENNLAYRALQANRALSDGKAAFHASRKNLHGSAVPQPDIATLSLMRAAVKKHKSDGIALNLMLKILLVGSDQETEAEKIMTSISAVATGEVNPFSGKLRVITDAEIDAHDAWYGLASASDAPILTYGYLNGAAGPSVEAKAGWDIDGAEYRIIHDFGVALTDWLGGYKVPTK